MAQTKNSVIDKINLKPRNFKQEGQPKCWQDKRVLRYMRSYYENTGTRKVKIRTALVTYLALTEISSNKMSDIFQATRKTLAKHAVVSVSTIRRYTDEFITMGILKKENIKDGKTNKANRWCLIAFNEFIHISVRNSGHTLNSNDKEGVCSKGRARLEVVI
ncbi:hypothetical protein HY450_02995 [Candidatus Pacearchaeota archaeon]|nr:hypothetical protein [Candidatus Pacearchaeota archaeon]